MPASVLPRPPLQPWQVVPILRAGLVILEQAATVIPHTKTYHLGMVRDEETLQVRLLVLPPTAWKVVLQESQSAAPGDLSAQP